MLIDILTNLAAATGFSLDNANQKLYLKDKVNEAAKRLYESGDLVYSCVDEIFNTAVGSHLITLPARVGHIRGMRYADGRRKVNNQSPEIRYHESGVNDVWPLLFREHPPSAIAADITNASTITFSIPVAVDTDTVVYIKGSNENSSNLVETVTIKAGDTEATTANDYESVKMLRLKTAITYDLTVTDASDNTLAVIPNNMLASRYKVVQVYDSFTNPDAAPNNGNAIEIHYKLALPVMQDDFDAFICGDIIYDEAIYWEFLKIWYARQEDKNGANMATVMVERLKKDIALDLSKGKLKKFDAAENKFLKMCNPPITMNRVLWKYP